MPPPESNPLHPSVRHLPNSTVSHSSPLAMAHAVGDWSRSRRRGSAVATALAAAGPELPAKALTVVSRHPWPASSWASHRDNRFQLLLLGLELRMERTRRSVQRAEAAGQVKLMLQ
jgi:hypothetical protein